jgi:hypothetical protein
MEISHRSLIDGAPIPHRTVLLRRRLDTGPVIERHQAMKMMPGSALPVALVPTLVANSPPE